MLMADNETFQTRLFASHTGSKQKSNFSIFSEGQRRPSNQELLGELITQINKLDPKPSAALLNVLGHFYLSLKHMERWLATQGEAVIISKELTEINEQMHKQSAGAFLVWLENKLKVTEFMARDTIFAKASMAIIARILDGHIGQITLDTTANEYNLTTAIEELEQLEAAIALSVQGVVTDEAGQDSSELQALKLHIQVLKEKADLLNKQQLMLHTSLMVTDNLITLARIFGQEKSSHELKALKQRWQSKPRSDGEETSLPNETIKRPDLMLGALPAASHIPLQSPSCVKIWGDLSHEAQKAVLDFARMQQQHLFFPDEALQKFFEGQRVRYTRKLSISSEQQVQTSLHAIMFGQGEANMLMNFGFVCVNYSDIDLDFMREVGFIEPAHLVSITKSPKKAKTIQPNAMPRQMSSNPSKVGAAVDDLLASGSLPPSRLIQNLKALQSDSAHSLASLGQKQPLPRKLGSLSDSSISYASMPSGVVSINTTKFREATSDEKRYELMDGLKDDELFVLLSELNEAEQKVFDKIYDEICEKRESSYIETKKRREVLLCQHVDEIFDQHVKKLNFSAEHFVESVITFAEGIWNDRKIIESGSEFDGMIIARVLSKTEELRDNIANKEQKAIIKQQLVNAYQLTIMYREAGYYPLSWTSSTNSEDTKTFCSPQVRPNNFFQEMPKSDTSKFEGASLEPMM